MVRVCGNEATVVSATATLLTLLTPPAFTPTSISTYGFTANSASLLSHLSTFGDDSKSESYMITDSALYEYYSSSNTASCHVGVDLGSGSRAILSKFELYPRSVNKTDAS